MSAKRRIAVGFAVAAIAAAPAGGVASAGVSGDCTRAVERYGAVQKRLAKAVENDASKRRIKRLKRKLRRAERRVERECG